MFNESYRIIRANYRWKHEKCLNQVTFALSIFISHFTLVSFTCRDHLPSANEPADSAVDTVWKHKLDSRNRQRACNMDCCDDKTNAYCDQFLHRKPGHGRCHHWTLLHSVSIPGSHPTALGPAEIHVSFLSLRSNCICQRVNIYANSYRYRQTQGDTKPAEGTLIEARIKNSHRSNLDVRSVAGGTNQHWIAS